MCPNYKQGLQALQVLLGSPPFPLSKGKGKFDSCLSSWKTHVEHISPQYWVLWGTKWNGSEWGRWGDTARTIQAHPSTEAPTEPLCCCWNCGRSRDCGALELLLTAQSHPPHISVQGAVCKELGITTFLCSWLCPGTWTWMCWCFHLVTGSLHPERAAVTVPTASEWDHVLGSCSPGAHFSAWTASFMVLGHMLNLCRASDQY